MKMISPTNREVDIGEVGGLLAGWLGACVVYSSTVQRSCAGCGLGAMAEGLTDGRVCVWGRRSSRTSTSA